MDPTEDSDRKTKEDIHKKRQREDRHRLYQDKLVTKILQNTVDEKYEGDTAKEIGVTIKERTGIDFTGIY